MSAEMLLAGIGLAACVAMLLRMAIGSRRRARLDAWLRGQVTLWQQRLRAAKRRPQAQDEAVREAQDLIERARRRRQGVEREGNVYRPRSFDGGDSADGRHRRDH